MKREKRFISSKILFEAISQQLACNRQAVFTVTGNSMWPFIGHGRDQVIVEKVDYEKLRRGDIILFEAAQDKYLLHRITGLYEDGFETTGDGNFFRDGRFPYTCITAQVRKVIRKGKTIDCGTFTWRVLSRTWMALYPFRKYVFRFWFWIRKYIK